MANTMRLPLDSDLLRTFVAVAETGNFTRAAEKAGRTQSALSMQMKKLEAIVGVHRHRVSGRASAPHSMTVYNGPVAMANVNDLRSIVQGVEQAEARGDHASAERLLRHALALQEASVGPNHPEVANILNNLAIVCELNGKLTDAEACYRRAYAIATSNLPANDPFVTTSRENLEQFCTARGIPLKDASAKEPKETPPVASSPAPNALSAFGPAASSAPPHSTR